MLTYKYIARDPTSGKKIKSEVQADSEQSAVKLIRKQGLTPVDVQVLEASKSMIGKLKGHIKTKDKVLFSRQLSTLVNAGLPLIQSLRNVASQTSSKPLKIIIGEIITDVEAGSTLSGAMARHPQAFNQVYLSLIAAGETSGTLDKSLERLANQQEKDAEIISKVRGALAYPAIVMLVMVVVVGFMVIQVVPQVKLLYDGIPGANLPFLTSVLLAVSDALITYWWIVLIFAIFAGFFMSRWVRTLGGKRFIDRVKMRAPLIGPLFMKMYMARFARIGTTLVASGVPLIQMLESTADSVNNVHIAASITRAIEKVKSGKALSEALAGDPNFLELVPNMLHIGEQSGAIEDMLAKTADYYEREVDNTIKAISTIIEPMLMVVLGVVAFIIVAAVLLPIYGLAGQSILR